MQRFTVYVENRLDHGSPYFVSVAAVEQALGDLADQARIVCSSHKQPDFRALEEADFFVGSGFDPLMLSRHGKRLRVAHCTSAGVEKYMPLDWLPDGAVLTNSSGVHAEKGGSFGAMTVMMLLEEVPRHVRNQRLHRWDNRLTRRSIGKTVVIVGFGALGKAIASKLKAFGVTIIGVSRQGAPDELADITVPVRDLHKVLPQADCVVLSCPLTPETRGLVGQAEICLMKPGSSLFNIARGPILDTAALLQSLEANHLSGAALDVFDHEPLQEGSPLWDAPNLMIFPHISCDDEDGYITRCLEIFGDNVHRQRKGLELRNVVDPKTHY